MLVFLCLLNGIMIFKEDLDSIFFLIVLFWFFKEVLNSIFFIVLFLCFVILFIFVSDYCDSVFCLVG